MRQILVVSLMAVDVGPGIAGQAVERFQLAEDDVIAFVGGTNMVHLQRAGHLESALTRAFASFHLKFRDLAWEADTVFAREL